MTEVERAKYLLLGEEGIEYMVEIMISDLDMDNISEKSANNIIHYTMNAREIFDIEFDLNEPRYFKLGEYLREIEYAKNRVISVRVVS